MGNDLITHSFRLTGDGGLGNNERILFQPKKWEHM